MFKGLHRRDACICLLVLQLIGRLGGGLIFLHTKFQIPSSGDLSLIDIYK
jgi:hypothetical protein